MWSSVPVPDVSGSEIEQLDLAIIELLRRRAELARELPPIHGREVTFPDSFRVGDVVGMYQSALGGPGELVARAILNLSRASLRTERNGRERDV